jgi:hypothetical protein
MRFQRRTVMQVAEMICGNFPQESTFFPYRSSSLLTEFFADVGTNYAHDGSTRQYWVADTLEKILDEPQAGAGKVPPTFARVIQRLMDPTDATNKTYSVQARWRCSTPRWRGRGSRRTTPKTSSATCGTSLPTPRLPQSTTHTGHSRPLNSNVVSSYAPTSIKPQKTS